MKQLPPPNVKGLSNTATRTPHLQPGCWNCIIGKEAEDGKQTASTTAGDPTLAAGGAAVPASAAAAGAPAPQRMDAANGSFVPTTEKEAHRAGVKAGMYTGCGECIDSCSLMQLSAQLTD